jgi:O-methyltransferase
MKRLLLRIAKRIVRKAAAEDSAKVSGALQALKDRVSTLEYRSFNRRFYAIEQMTDYLVGAQVPGDYCEFGVWKGDTFKHAFAYLGGAFPEMRFYAFDSFEGLPEPKGLDSVDGYASNFHESEFSCSLESFMGNMREASVDLSRVVTVKGWFDQTLKTGSHGIKKIAAAWIDCDLYESTVPVLEFLTPYLSSGSVIIFDDWRCYKNHPEFGEQRACREWLGRNPSIKLSELFSFGWNGIAFTVQ